MEETITTTKKAARKKPETIKYNCEPHIAWQRNSYGLLEHLNYEFNEDGSVNWRKMIKKEYLVPNREMLAKSGKNIPEDISELEDKELLILLGGIKDLAKIRGYITLEYTPFAVSENFVSVECTIGWIPNYETNNNTIYFSALADASKDNTFSWYGKYLTAAAENRAFVRAVRNFLGINIVGQDEIGPNTPDTKPQNKETSLSIHDTLQEKMNKHDVSFEKLKASAIKKEIKNAENWQSVYDLQPQEVWNVLGHFAKKEQD